MDSLCLWEHRNDPSNLEVVQNSYLVRSHPGTNTEGLSALAPKKHNL